MSDVGEAGGLYDPTMLRRLELRFAQANWWQQRSANHASERSIPAEPTVDGVLSP